MKSKAFGITFLILLFLLHLIPLIIYIISRNINTLSMYAGLLVLDIIIITICDMNGLFTDY